MINLYALIISKYWLNWISGDGLFDWAVFLSRDKISINSKLPKWTLSWGQSEACTGTAWPIRGQYLVSCLNIDGWLRPRDQVTSWPSEHIHLTRSICQGQSYHRVYFLLFVVLTFAIIMFLICLPVLAESERMKQSVNSKNKQSDLFHK